MLRIQLIKLYGFALIYYRIKAKGDDFLTEFNEIINEVNEDSQKGRYLIFALGKEMYGIEIQHIIEIIGIQTITTIPDMPEYIKGIINLRGKIIPLMDVRIRLNKEAKDYNDRTCVIVVDVNDESIGLIVDSVSEVLSIPEQDTVEPPVISNGNINRYIKKIGKVGTEVKLLLDCSKLFTEDILNDLIISN